MSELYGQIIGMGITPVYFLDEMSWSELASIFKASGERSREDWERTRTLCFYTVIAQGGTKHFKKPSDLFKLPWDDKKEKPKTVQPAKKLSPEEFKDLVEKVNKQFNGSK